MNKSAILTCALLAVVILATVHPASSESNESIAGKPETTPKPSRPSKQQKPVSHHVHLHPTAIKYRIIRVDYEHVVTPYTIIAWVMAVIAAKLIMNLVPGLTAYLPESVGLLIIGLVIGLIGDAFDFDADGSLRLLNYQIFFLYLLPLIVLDASYAMPQKKFFGNFWTILTFAFAGTFIISMCVGFSLYGVGTLDVFKFKLPVHHALLYGSIIAATDPVAVLALFEEIRVERLLYTLVFAEALLNDAVTVALSNVFTQYSEMEEQDEVKDEDYASGLLSFCVISLGGIILGIVSGILIALGSRIVRRLPTIEPLFPIAFSYLVYLSADALEFSAILALTFCGLTIKHYLHHNFSSKDSTVSFDKAIKCLSHAAEAATFVLLGASTVTYWKKFDIPFAILSILFCIVFRVVAVVCLSFILNRFRKRKLGFVDQFFLSYSGLRGAVAFCLIIAIDETVIPAKDYMVTGCLTLVYFTVVVKGCTLLPLIKLLKVPLERTVIVIDQDGSQRELAVDTPSEPATPAAWSMVSEPNTPGFINSNQTTITALCDGNHFNWDSPPSMAQRSTSTMSNRSAISLKLKGIHDTHLRPWLVHGPKGQEGSQNANGQLRSSPQLDPSAMNQFRINLNLQQSRFHRNGTINSNRKF